jgi:hypothetical protein
MAELRASLAQAKATPDTPVKKAGRKIGAALGTIAAVTHLSPKK